MSPLGTPQNSQLKDCQGPSADDWPGVVQGSLVRQGLKELKRVQKVTPVLQPTIAKNWMDSLAEWEAAKAQGNVK
jgi:hypothetical protein